MNEGSLSRLIHYKQEKAYEYHNMNGLNKRKIPKEDVNSVSCKHCGVQVKVGDKVVSKISCQGGLFYRTRVYHYPCARQINIV